MKKAKRILSLVLAVMLVMSVFVLPASAAAPDDEVEPCGPTNPQCPECRTQMQTGTAADVLSSSYVSSCENSSDMHLHFVMGWFVKYYCSNCGYSYVTSNRANSITWIECLYG